MVIGIRSNTANDFHIIKSNSDLMIGGYASIEMVDKQNDLITLKALKEAVNKFMVEKNYRNVMTNHSNVQVGEVVPNYRDKSGKLWKTDVDDVGFFVVIKLRDDIEKAKEINRGIRKGSLRSFSIGGQALQKVKKSNSELGEFNEISKLELHEVTICESGINPEAKFNILKQNKQEAKNMSKLEKALAELDTLLDEVNTLRKEDESPSDLESDGEVATMEYMGDEPDDDDARKGETSTLAGPIQTGEPEDKIVVSGGKPTGDSQADNEHDVNKTFANEEFSTLNLSVENIEKAYAQYRAEQLESLAYGGLTDTFAKRFANETSQRNETIAKANYDAQGEIASLTANFAELRESLTTEKNTIRKAQEAVSSVKVFSTDEIADMSWEQIHNAVGGNI
jgi:HK97 family phage prohead protease